MTHVDSSHGFRLREFANPADVPALLRLLEAAEAVDRSGEDISAEMIAAQLDVPNHAPRRDRAVVEHPTDAGSLIGQSALWTAPADDPIIGEATLVVHPEWRNRGIGSALLDTMIARATDLDASFVRLYADPNHAPTVAFLQHRQFAPVAAYTEMRSTTAIDEAALPEGFSITPFALIRDVSTLAEALTESYAGLWGHHKVTVADLEQWLPHIEQNGAFLLFDAAGKVAGICRAEQHEQRTERNAQPTGYIDAPGVVPRYRSPELYAALLAHAVHWLREQAQIIELESWGDSAETLMLYQSLGFEVLRQQIAYQRSIRSV